MNILKLQRRAVANLTIEQQVVKEPSGLESLPGYVLVVFEKRDNDGAIFVRLVSSGERFHSRNPFRDLSKKYFAVAVNDSMLSYAFDHSISLDDGSETFTLNFHLTYRAVAPRKVAEIREQDPLRQLRDEVVRVIGRNCAKRKLDMFRDRFRDLERIVIDRESVRLRPYAAELGFKIISIDLDKPLPEHKRKVIDVRNTYDRSAKDLKKRIAVRQKVADIQRSEQNRRLRGVQTDTIGQSLTNVAAVIDTPEKLREGFEVAWEIARETGVAVQPDGGSIPTPTEEPPEASQRAAGDAQTKGIDDSEQTTLDSSFVYEDAAQSLPRKTWKNETSRLIKLMEDVGADPETTIRVRKDLEAIAARYFPPTDISKSGGSTVPEETRRSDSDFINTQQEGL